MSPTNTRPRHVSRKFFGVSSIPYGGFYITGVDHEAAALGKSLEELFQLLTDRIRDSSLSEPLRSYVNSHLKNVRYFDKTVFVFEIAGQHQPSLFKKGYFERQGTNVIEVEAQNFSSLFSRFN